MVPFGAKGGNGGHQAHGQGHGEHAGHIGEGGHIGAHEGEGGLGGLLGIAQLQQDADDQGAIHHAGQRADGSANGDGEGNGDQPGRHRLRFPAHAAFQPGPDLRPSAPVGKHNVNEGQQLADGDADQSAHGGILRTCIQQHKGQGQAHRQFPHLFHHLGDGSGDHLLHSLHIAPVGAHEGYKKQGRSQGLEAISSLRQHVEPGDVVRAEEHQDGG